MSTQDSPLSITSSVAGILTFVAAIAAAIYARFTYLRNADSEYFQVKASLSWYKTESAWLHDLVHAADGPKARSGNEMEYQMYVFVMEQLGQLEERLLELVTETEISASKEGSRRWTFVPRGIASRGGVAMSWLAVRTKALELVRQRDALGARVLFSQMSMMSSRVRDQESRAKEQEDVNRERLDRLERMVYSQHEKLDRLESLVYRLMHRTRLASETELRPRDDVTDKYDFFTVRERRKSLPATSSTAS
ncbi:hypothetical protein ACMFMG_002342 [Clarireedia jacksonii]